MSNEDKERSRIIETIIGIIGGLFGIFDAILAIIIGSGHTYNVPEADLVFGMLMTTLLGYIQLIFAITGIIGAVIVRYNNKIAGSMMLISASGVIITGHLNYVQELYIFSFILLLIAGIMGFRK